MSYGAMPSPGKFPAAAAVAMLTAVAQELGSNPELQEALEKEAAEEYPLKAEVEEAHHVLPKYLGGLIEGATVKLNGAYHQLITNDFGAEFRMVSKSFRRRTRL